MSKHTKGPWAIGPTNKFKPNSISVYSPSEGLEICRIEVTDEDPAADRADAARIVACVNACEGIEDPSVMPEVVRFVEMVSRLSMGTIDDDAMDSLIGASRSLLARVESKTV